MKNSIIINSPLNPVTVGKIGKTYGILGWVKVILFTDNFFYYDAWFVRFQSQWVLLQLESWKFFKNHYIVKFISFRDREFAALFKNFHLIVDRSQFPVLSSDEYYWQDIIGCKVFTLQNNDLGHVNSIIETTAHDVLVISNKEYDLTNTKIYLIPFINNKIVKNVDLVANTIIVDWGV